MMPQLENICRYGRILGWLATLTWVAGCSTTTQPSGEPVSPPATSAEAHNGKAEGLTGRSGEVAHVNRAFEYVVVKGRNLPSSGVEATLYREGWPVGVIRFAAPRRSLFAAADIVEGQPHVGDRLGSGSPQAGPRPDSPEK